MRRLLLAALATATTAALVAAVPATASDSPAPVNPRAGVPIPEVSALPRGPIFTGALQKLSARGYVEREFVVTIKDPQVYAYVGETTQTTATAAPKGTYRSRFIVRMPADPAAFNGRVLVEMMNTTATVDLDIAWQQAHEYLMRDGWAYVGITVQQTGVRALTNFTRSPKRYTGLRLNLQVPKAKADLTTGMRDPSLAWDLTSQVGALMASESATSPLAGYDVRSLYLTGQSQMAGYAVTYVNAIQPRHQVFDGFLVAYRGSRATNLQYAAPVGGVPPATSASPAQRTLAGGGAPVISLQTETDPIGDAAGTDAAVWRADSDDTTDRFRLWEVAGSSHNDRHGAEQALRILERDYGSPFATTCDWKSPSGVNSFPMRFAWHSALEALAAWHEEGIAPAMAPRIERSAGAIARDSRGNARGGIRLPRIDVPVATLGPASTGGLFCNLTGFQTPFSKAVLARLYPTTSAYVRLVQEAADADVAAGFLLAEDARALVESARRGPAADAQTIREY